MHWQSPPPTVSDNGSGSTSTVKRGPAPEFQGSFPLPLRQANEQDAPIHNTQAGLDRPLQADQTPAQIKRRRQVQSRRGRPRKPFPTEKRKETAKTRERGACIDCRRARTRCHESHFPGFQVPPVPVIESPNVRTHDAAAIANNTPARPPDFLDGYAPKPDSPLNRFLGDPNGSQPLIEYIAPPNQLGVGGGGGGALHFGENDFDDVGSYLDSQQTYNSFVPAQHQMRRGGSGNRGYSMHGMEDGGRGPHYTRSVPPGQSNSFPGPVAIGNEGNNYLRPPPGNVEMANMQQVNPIANHTRYDDPMRGNGTNNLQPQPQRPNPTSVRSAPPTSDGLTQTAATGAENFSYAPALRNEAPFRSIVGVGSRFGNMGMSMQNEAAPYGQTTNPGLGQTPFSSQGYQQHQGHGYGQTSHRHPNGSAPYQGFGGQLNMRGEGMGGMAYQNNNSNISHHMQQNMPSSFMQDGTFGIPPNSGFFDQPQAQARNQLPPQQFQPNDIDVAHFDFSSFLLTDSVDSIQPFMERTGGGTGYDGTSSHFNAMQDEGRVGPTELPIRLAQPPPQPQPQPVAMNVTMQDQNQQQQGGGQGSMSDYFFSETYDPYGDGMFEPL